MNTSTRTTPRTLTPAQSVSVRRTLEGSYRFHPNRHGTIEAWAVFASGRVEVIPTTAHVGQYTDRPVVAVIVKLRSTRPADAATAYRITGRVQPSGCELPIETTLYGASVEAVVAEYREVVRSRTETERATSATAEKRLERALRSIDWTAWASDDYRQCAGMRRGIERARSIAAELPEETARRVWASAIPTDGTALALGAWK